MIFATFTKKFHFYVRKIYYRGWMRWAKITKLMRQTKGTEKKRPRLTLHITLWVAYFLYFCTFFRKTLHTRKKDFHSTIITVYWLISNSFFCGVWWTLNFIFRFFFSYGKEKELWYVCCFLFFFELAMISRIINYY